MNYRKIGIVGCGNVGATIAYSAMSSGIFSEMVMIDRNEDRARGEAMDISHCLPFLAPMSIYQGSYDKLKDAGIVVVAAGANQDKNETRLDLVQKNAKIISDIIPRIAEVNNECILIIVTNPVDILTYLSIELSGFDKSRVIGSGTVLDTGRLKYLIGERLNVDSRNVHTFIIGEHGDSELAVWSSANVSGIDLKDYLSMCKVDFSELYNIYDYVVKSAYEIIKGKGASYYGIAHATMRIIKSIIMNENTILPVSTYVSGHYDLNDVCLSVPCVIGKTGVKHVLDIPLNVDEYKRLHSSARTIREAIDSISVKPQ